MSQLPSDDLPGHALHGLGDIAEQPLPLLLLRHQARSKRSAFITLFQAATKSCTNFSWASSCP